MKKMFICIAVLLITSAVLTGCASPDATRAVVGEMDYKVINIPSPEFEKLYEGDFADWYSTNYMVEGMHTFTRDNNLYMLISAGEKPTGGYYLEDLTVEGKENEIEVNVRLHAPGIDEMVIQALTYPHILVYMPEDEREIIFKGIKESTQDIKKDSGRYSGRIDSNSIEVKISGVPEEMAARAFQLSDEVKNSFESYGLETGDEIIFSYITNQHGQNIIVEINKMK